jgi:hypothetical protein
MHEASGQYEEWLAAHQRLRPNQPVDPSYYLITGRLDEAQRTLDAALARDQFPQTPATASGPSRTSEGLDGRPVEARLLRAQTLLAALRGDSRTAEANIAALLERHPVKDPYYHHTAHAIAGIYALGGKSADAVKWLREAVATGYAAYPLFERDPALDRIRSVPEFQTFMRELKATTDGYRREFDRPVR